MHDHLGAHPESSEPADVNRSERFQLEVACEKLKRDEELRGPDRRQQHYADMAMGAALQERVRVLEAALRSFKSITREAYALWDADRDAQAGKLIAALAGGMPKYRADVDAIHAALEQSNAAGQERTPAGLPELSGTLDSSGQASPCAQEKTHSYPQEGGQLGAPVPAAPIRGGKGPQNLSMRETYRHAGITLSQQAAAPDNAAARDDSYKPDEQNSLLRSGASQPEAAAPAHWKGGKDGS